MTKPAEYEIIVFSPTRKGNGSSRLETTLSTSQRDRGLRPSLCDSRAWVLCPHPEWGALFPESQAFSTSAVGARSVSGSVHGTWAGSEIEQQALALLGDWWAESALSHGPGDFWSPLSLNPSQLNYFLFLNFSFFLSVCAGSLLLCKLSLVVASEGYPLVAGCGLLVMVASLVVEHRL